MLSRNNFKEVTKRDAQNVPHYGLRKLSIGVASVLLSTTLYMGVSASADTVIQPDAQLSPTELPASTGTQVNAPKEVASPTNTDASAVAISSSNVSSESSSNTTTSKNSNVGSTNAPANTTKVTTSLTGETLQNMTNKPALLENNPVLSTNNAEPATLNNAFTVNGDINNSVQPNASFVSPFISLATVSTTNEKQVTFTHGYRGTFWLASPLGHPVLLSTDRTSDFFDHGMFTVGEAKTITGTATYNPSTNKYSNVRFNSGLHYDGTRIPDLSNYYVITAQDSESKETLSAWLKSNGYDGYYVSGSLSTRFNSKDSSYMDAGFQPSLSTNNVTSDAVTSFKHRDETGIEALKEENGDPSASEFLAVDGNGKLAHSFVLIVVPYKTEYQQVSRTIKIHRPDGEIDTITQTANLKNVSQVSAEPVEGGWGPNWLMVMSGTTKKTNNWNTGNWEAYNAPVIAGYTASQPTVSSRTVTHDMGNQTVDITYTANAQSVSVKYVDDEANGTQIGATQTLKGTTGSKVATNIKAPTNYVLSGTYPAEYTFTAAANQQLVVHLKHAKQSVNDQKTVTRTVNYTDPKTSQAKLVERQTVTLHRTGIKDLVTNNTAWNAWSTDQFKAVSAPSVAGYQVTNGNAAGAMTVTDQSRDTTVIFTYTANAQTTHIKYVDKDNPSNVIHTTNVNGKTDQTVSVPSEVPAGWQLVSGQQVPTRVTFTDSGYPDTTVKIEHKHTTVTPDYPKTTNDKLPDNPAKSYPSGVSQNDLNKTISRTIQVVDPHTQKVATTTQSVHLTRTANVDEVNGAVTYGNWSTGEWPVFNTPSVAGYTPTQANVAKSTVTDTTKDQTVKITYNANAQTTHVKYVDKDNPSNVIHTTNVSGKTDQIVSVPNEVPAGWQLVSGQQVPTRITFTATGYSDTIVKIEHKHTTVSSDHPKTTNDKLPDNPTKNYPAGVGQNDLNKTITRMIQVTDPHTQTVTTTNQTVHLIRTADVDEVSGAVTYGKWTTGEWPTFNAPVVAGYTPSQASVAKTTVTDTSKDQTVKITYNANVQTTHVKYVDKDNPSNVIHTTNINGKTDQTVSVPSEVPAGWQLVSGQQVPTSIIFTATGYPDTTVKIEHKHTTVTPNQPKTINDKLPDNPTINYPAGVGQTDLNKTITRTIQVTDPHTQKVATTTQTVHLTRTADVDEVSGAVTYGQWTTGEWPAFNVPSVPGYTPTEANVAKTTVTDTTKDQTDKITYTANSQTTQVNYVDQSGKVVHSTLIKGVTDQTVKVPSEVPTNWQLISGQTVPSEITFGANGHEPVTVKIEHQTTTTQAQKTITRTINYVDANGKHLKPATVQRLTFTRTGVQDLVTKAIAWQATPAQSFAAVNNLYVLGYKADMTTVPEVTINWDDQDSVIDVHYQVANSTVTINFVDALGRVVKATPVTGQVGSTVDLAAQVPDGWVTYSPNMPTRVVIGANPAAINYLIGHRLALVTSTAGVKAGDLIPGTQTKTFNDKVNAANLVTHAAYTINVWADAAHTRKLATQTYHADFIRNAVVDAVTGDVYYFNWSEGGQHGFAGFTRQAGNGYQAVVVPAWTATQANPTKMVDVVAQPQQAAGTIQYQTMDGAVISRQAFVGNQAVTLTAPQGYTLLTNVAAITPALGQDQTYTVYVRPAQTLYTATDKLPAGVESLRKTITRTIHITEANGHVRTITQRVHFTRTATVKADGSIEYSDWQATGRAVWNKVFLPKRHGYHVVIDNALAKLDVTTDMSDIVVNVKYVKD